MEMSCAQLQIIKVSGRVEFVNSVTNKAIKFLRTLIAMT